MKFSDNIIRNNLDIVFVKRSEKEMEDRLEYNSNLWDIHKEGISFDATTRAKVNIYSTPARDVKIGENIYNSNGDFVAYRSN
jgi:hypothetical protein